MESATYALNTLWVWLSLAAACQCPAAAYRRAPERSHACSDPPAQVRQPTMLATAETVFAMRPYVTFDKNYCKVLPYPLYYFI